MANEKQKKKPAPSLVDVAPPGTTAPSPTGKAVIIPSNHPMLQDPMMVAQNDTAAASELNAVIAPPSRTKLTLQPLHGDEAIAASPSSSVVNTNTEAAPTETIETQLPVTHETTQPASDPEPSPEPSTSPEAPPSSDVTADVGKTAAEMKEVDLDKAAEIAAKHEVEVQAVIESKEYFLPINSREVRRVKRFVVLGIIVSLFLAAAWVDVALDAGLIHIGGLKPVTHFFSGN